MYFLGLSCLSSAVDHLESIHLNSLKVFSCILVFGPVQLAVQLLLHICLLFSPARSSHFFKHLLQVHLPSYLIYLFSDHIHPDVQILRLELYPQGRTDIYCGLLPGTFTTSLGSSSLAPTSLTSLSALLITIPGSIDSTLLYPGSTHLPSLPGPHHEKHSLTTEQLVPPCVLSAFPGTTGTGC